MAIYTLGVWYSHYCLLLPSITVFTHGQASCCTGKSSQWHAVCHKSLSCVALLRPSALMYRYGLLPSKDRQAMSCRVSRVTFLHGIAMTWPHILFITKPYQLILATQCHAVCRESLSCVSLLWLWNTVSLIWKELSNMTFESKYIMGPHEYAAQLYGLMDRGWQEIS